MIKIYLRFKLNIIELLIKWYLDHQDHLEKRVNELENNKRTVLFQLRRAIENHDS